jgi:hypothetical protein
MWIANLFIWALLLLVADAHYGTLSSWKNVVGAGGAAKRQVVGENVPLRICLIGDSILVGYASMDFNGFRQKLYDAFVNSGEHSNRCRQSRHAAHSS